MSLLHILNLSIFFSLCPCVCCMFLFSMNAFLCIHSLCMCAFVFICVCVCVCPSPATAAGSKTAGERAAPAAFPSHPTHWARLPPAPDSHSPANQGSDPGGQRACHPTNSTNQHPIHPIYTGPRKQQQVCVWGEGGPGRAEPCLREPGSRKRLWFLRGWKWADRGRPSYSSSTE